MEIKIRIFIIITACFALLLYLKHFDIISDEINETEEEFEKCDQPDKAAEQEFLKTRDLTTNTVPKERLVEAF